MLNIMRLYVKHQVGLQGFMYRIWTAPFLFRKKEEPQENLKAGGGGKEEVQAYHSFHQSQSLPLQGN